MHVREYEHYEYKFDNDEEEVIHEEDTNESDYFDDYADSHEYGNEMARSAVERFLESETSDDENDNKKMSKLPQQEDLLDPDNVKRTGLTPKYDEDEEYMSRLADARRERQRRSEKNPVPKPAVRVNVERPRRSQPAVVLDKPQADEEWAPMAEEDFENFRKRYSEPHVMTPRDTKTSERTRSTTSVRRTSDVAEGPNPLRYMLAFIVLGVLALMVILAVNNRNLRLDVARLETNAATVNNNAAELVTMSLERDYYQGEVASLREENTMLREQLGYGNEEYDLPYTTDPEGTTTARPDDEAGTTSQTDIVPPPAPAPVIHIVQSGQVLSRIANYHFGSSAQRYIDLIVAANENLTDPNDIYVGQELIIPVLD